MSLTYTHEPFGDEHPASPPLWRDAVVGASIAAIAAAAGLGMHHEAGAAPWLASVAGVLTATALWGAHRQLGGGLVGMPKTTASGPKARARPATSAPVAKPELSTFKPRTAAPAASPPIMPVPAAAPQGAATAGAAPVSVVAPALPRNEVVHPGIDPEAQFLHLQGLVRQLAADVPGPRAADVDPRQLEARTSEQGDRLLVGFAPAPLEAPRPLSPLARLAEAVAAERFDVMLEPVQSIAEARARHFEISVRFRDDAGEVLAADDVARIARNTGLATSIDVLKLPRVAKVVQRVQGRGGSPADVLTELAGSSLSDHHFMEAFAGSFPNGVPGSLVLSFAQADVRAFARIHWGALNALSDMGLRFALADVTDLDMDFDLLRARSFVFAKLDVEIFLNGLPCAGSTIPATDICGHLARAGLDVVLSGIDTEAQLGRIAPYGISLGQGRLFGSPRPVKPDILR